MRRRTGLALDHSGPGRAARRFRLQEADAPGRLSSAAGRAPGHHRERAGRGRHPAGHHGGSEIEGVGRGAPDQRRNRTAGQARGAAGAHRSAERQKRAGAGPGQPGRGEGQAGQLRPPEGPRRPAVHDAGDHRGRTRQRAARLRRRQVAGGERAGCGGQRQDPARGHRRSRADHRHDHRAGHRTRHGHRLGDVQRERRHDAAQDGQPRPGPGNTLVDETDVGKIEPGQDATITVDAYPNRHLRGHRSQDRAPGADPAERDRLSGAGPDPQRGADCFGRA